MNVPVRTPVRTSAPGNLLAKIRILGVDTGLANVGLGIVEGIAQPEQLCCVHVEVLRTKKADKKERRKLRVSTDDARRLEEIFDHISALVAKHHPQGIAVEAYTPNPNQRGVGAWKTAMSYALVLALGRSLKLPVFTYLPADIKRPFGGRLSASKEAVAEALVERVGGFKKEFGKIPDSLKEHASDACAHAVLGIQEMAALRRLMGVG